MINPFCFSSSIESSYLSSCTFCVFTPESGVKSAPYACYVGGNCEFGPVGTHAPDGTDVVGNNTIVTECPTSALAADKVGPGGWRGKVGLLGVATNGRNVCFSEELAGEPVTLDTARNYYTRNRGLNEGINTPFNCHDMLIIDGKSTARQIHEECVVRANEIGGFILASKKIERDIGSRNNVFVPTVNTSYCLVQSGTTYTITGRIDNANSTPGVLTVTDGSVTNNCSASTSSYICPITTTGSSVTITGVYNTETVACSVSPITSTGCALTFTVSNDPTYTLNGNISGTSAAADAVVVEVSAGGTCVNNNNGTYQCIVTTGLTTVDITATIASGGAVTNVPQTINLTGTTIDVPTDLGATMVSTYTISGLISLGNNVDVNTMTVAVDTGTGSCSLVGVPAENTTLTYSCSVATGANHLNIALSPNCSTGGGSKKYEIQSTGVTSTLGTGTMVIDLGTVSGDSTKNISVLKSNSNC